jgi:hypothetical protein
LEYLDAYGIIYAYDEFTSAISLSPTLRGVQLSFCSVLEYKDASDFIEILVDVRLRLSKL